MNRLAYKRKLETALKESHLTSGGMSIIHCSVAIDSIGVVTIQAALNTGGLVAEAVEELVATAFESVRVKSFIKDDWHDITVDISSPTVTRVTASAVMGTVTETAPVP